VDTYLAIASRRDVKRYRPGAIPEDVVSRILDAGRLSGSAMNRQPWRFLVVEGAELRERLAASVYEPANVRGAALVVAVIGSGRGPVAFDCGRASQSMLLAAWNEGVASSPNGIADPGLAASLLGLGEEEKLQIVLSFGFPGTPRDPASRRPEEWSASANRRPLAETVRRL
jgi:nitroreductase